ncbi:MAG: hypothetical protein ACOC1F_14425 [Myxococcota bacterium]
MAPTWDRTNDGLVRRLRLYRLGGGDSLAVELVADLTGPEVITHASATRAGRVVGAASGGAGLYGPAGLEQTFACTPGEGQPVAAISPSGEWVVTSHVDHMLREHLPSGARTELRADGFKGFDGAQICDDGTVYTSGFRYPSHGLWRLGEDDEPRRVSDDIRATVRADGRALAEVQHGHVTLCDPTRTSEDATKLAHVIARAELPVLGMAKYGRAAFGVGGTLVVLTDAYTVASVVLSGPAR